MKTGQAAEAEYIGELDRGAVECMARARELLARDLDARRRRKEWAEGLWFSAPNNAGTRERLLFGTWISERDWEAWGPVLRPYILLEVRKGNRRGSAQ